MKCKLRNDCIVLCDKLKQEREGAKRLKKLTQKELVDYVIFVLITAGVNPLRLLQAAKAISKIPQRTLYFQLPSNIEQGKKMTDYFLFDQSKISFTEN
jgi:hypothetical protein